jgi:hypothetical protein
MKPLFTIHAGEYLLGSHIEACYPGWNVWLPAKDTGVDLLATNGRNTKTVSLQVKFSKDFNPTHNRFILQRKIVASGWWKHKEAKIKDSRADFWVFVLPSFTEHENSFIIITPRELHRRLKSIHGKARSLIHSYFWVTKSGRCWETRGLNNADQEMIAFDRFSNATRDFTQYLDDWSGLEKRLTK